MVDLDLQGYYNFYRYSIHTKIIIFDMSADLSLKVRWLVVCCCRHIPKWPVNPVTNPGYFLYIQGGPLPVINGVITPLIGVASPHLPIYFRPFRGAPQLHYNWRGPHLVGNCTTQLYRDYHKLLLGSLWRTHWTLLKWYILFMRDSYIN